MDRDSFAELVRRHQPGVSRFVTRYLRSREDNDEVVQETFLRAWQQIARFKPDTNFAAWVMTIARFLCMARIKDVQRHPPPASLGPQHEPASAALPDDLERLRVACEKLPDCLHVVRIHQENIRKRTILGVPDKFWQSTRR